MGDERAGILVLGILGDMADLIAGLHEAFAEEAWVADIRMAVTERAGLSEAHSPQIDPRPHLAA
jgi:hypothetical protein